MQLAIALGFRLKTHFTVGAYLPIYDCRSFFSIAGIVGVRHVIADYTQGCFNQ